MLSRRESSRRPRPANEAHLLVSLQRTGLSSLGIKQALGGKIVSDPSDRAAIARVLAAFASLPPHTALAIYDYVGEYAQRFDGVNIGKDD